MKKQSQANLVHHLGLGKRQCLADESRQSLPQSIIPSLDVRSLTGVFTTSGVLFVWDDLLISLPEICITMPRLIAGRDRLPQLSTSLFTTVTDDKGDHLASRPTQSDPHPSLVDPLENE